MKQLLVILGPTSTGKTDLALFIAKKFNGELVSADSRQVYKGLDIGTGKYPSGKREVKKDKGFWEIDGIRVWMYDVVRPNKQYTVAAYVKAADKIIEAIKKKNKLPIIVGGTGLYIKAVVDGLSNLAIPVDQKLRKNLEKLSLLQLQQKLKTISSKKWESLTDSDRQNPRRLVRAIELAKSTGYSSMKKYQALKIGLIAPRKILYQKADQRVIKRIDQGMINEAEETGLSLKRMKQLGLEYGILADYLVKKISKEQLIKILQGKIHGFIRRQLTWFKKEKEVRWFDVSKKGYQKKVENLVYGWYDSAKYA